MERFAVGLHNGGAALGGGWAAGFECATGWAAGSTVPPLPPRPPSSARNTGEFPWVSEELDLPTVAQSP